MSPAKPALVGGFVLGGLALAVTAILLLFGAHLFQRRFHAVTYFQGSVAGLDVGAPVTFRGVRIGSVTQIGLNLNLKDQSALIPVYLDLDSSSVRVGASHDWNSKADIDRLRNAGLQAQLGTQSYVTGELRVDLDLQPNIHSTYLGGNVNGNEIPSSKSKLQTLEAEIEELPLRQIAENARQALATINRVAAEIEPRVGPLADSLKRTSDAAHVTMDAAHVAVDHIDSLAIEGRQQVAVNGDELARVLASSDRTVREADALVASLNTMTAPNSQMRDDLNSATRDLAATASSLRAFSHEIERNPSDLLRRGKTP